MSNQANIQPLTGTPAARVGVAGAAGYLGALSANLLWSHPGVELVSVSARSDAGRQLNEVYPRYRVPLTLAEYSVQLFAELDFVLVAYPHGASAGVVAELRAAGPRVLDLSADFRLRDADVYAKTYGEHGAPDLFGTAVYGLPELHREAIPTAEIVAVPGCYPTAALLALAPLARAGIIESATIDAKSGISGAGRSPMQATHFVTADENVTPYAVGGHRHAPEIAQELAGLGSAAEFTFVPHLVPVEQGLLASCYVRPAKRVSGDEVAAIFADAYGGEPFVELSEVPPGVRDVRDTNVCRIHTAVDSQTGTAVIFAAIDNLWKGGAGQAVQDLNIMLGLDEATGLR